MRKDTSYWIDISLRSVVLALAMSSPKNRLDTARRSALEGKYTLKADSGGSVSPSWVLVRKAFSTVNQNCVLASKAVAEADID